jgi:1-acyl-sn-glycerol-3-phosphate acyltransferase
VAPRDVAKITVRRRLELRPAPRGWRYSLPVLQHGYLERFESRHRVVRASLRYRLARRVIRFGLRLLFRLRLEGAPPRCVPYVLVANHQNWADVFAILALFPSEPQLYFLGDERQMRRSWWKWALVRFFGPLLPLDRTLSTSRSALRGALERLNDGAAVGIFARSSAASATSR